MPDDGKPSFPTAETSVVSEESNIVIRPTSPLVK
jgi:hypothetical protein